MAAFREGTSNRHRTGHRTGGGKKGEDNEPSKNGGSNTTGTGDSTEPTPPRRELVSPTTLRLRDPEGQETKGTKGHKPPRKTGGGDLVEPGGAVPPKTRTTPRNYTDEEKESVGLELLQMALKRDLVDVRGKRGVGADALDEEEGEYFELKVSGGNEPDVVSLTASEVKRAAATKDKFVLAVVSGVEGADACPTVRLILDPLKKLEAGAEDGKINLAGVRSSGVPVYQFERDNDAVEGKEETPTESPRVGGG